MKILIVDNQGIVREGLQALVEKQPDMEVVGEAGDGRTAVKLARELLPDIVIMDITMPNLDGIDETRQITKQIPDAKVIALSINSDSRFVADMLRAGASGYLLKTCLFDDFVQAIRTVTTGKIYLSRQVTNTMINDYISIVRIMNKLDFPDVAKLTQLALRNELTSPEF